MPLLVGGPLGFGNWLGLGLDELTLLGLDLGWQVGLGGGFGFGFEMSVKLGLDLGRKRSDRLLALGVEPVVTGVILIELLGPWSYGLAEPFGGSLHFVNNGDI